MKGLKVFAVAAVMGLGFVGVAQAATPEENCNKAVGKAANDFFKQVGKTLKDACAGKDVAALTEKAAAKLQKSVEKLDATDTKLECATVLAMNMTDAFPIEAADYDATENGYETLVNSGDAQCGLTLTVDIDLVEPM